MNYKEADKLLKGRNRNSKKIENNTYLKRSEDTISLWYRDTEAVKFNPNGDMILSHGGYKTRTTRLRINSVLPKGYKIEQKGDEWYLKDRPFVDGMVLHQNGSVSLKDENLDKNKVLEEIERIKGNVSEILKELDSLSEKVKE